MMPSHSDAALSGTSSAYRRRLATIHQAMVASPTASAATDDDKDDVDAAAGTSVLSLLRRWWLGNGSSSGGNGECTTGDQEAAAAVSGVVRACFVRSSDEQRAGAAAAGLWTARTGRFARQRATSLRLSADPHAPGLHPFARADIDPSAEAPLERAVLCQTAEAYDKLRAGLPPANATFLSAERPGSGEDLFVDGLVAWELCVGDVLGVVVAGGGGGEAAGLLLQVSSPRRPCEQWNVVHAGEDFLSGTVLAGQPAQRCYPSPASSSSCADEQGKDAGGGGAGGEEGRGSGRQMRVFREVEGNVRHVCLQQTLGGFFLRVLRGGDVSVGDRLTLVSRPRPGWTLRRVGALLYGRAAVAREGWVAWCGTDAEREALLAMPELAEHEWKDVLRDPQLELRRNY
jgi:MOSC domain-containing protein YiiM